MSTAQYKDSLNTEMCEESIIDGPESLRVPDMSVSQISCVESRTHFDRAESSCVTSREIGSCFVMEGNRDTCSNPAYWIKIHVSSLVIADVEMLCLFYSLVEGAA